MQTRDNKVWLEVKEMARLSSARILLEHLSNYPLKGGLAARARDAYKAIEALLEAHDNGLEYDDDET